MKELIEALEEIFRKGIVVQPIEDGVFRINGGGPFLIRLATDEDKQTERERVLGGLGR